MSEDRQTGSAPGELSPWDRRQIRMKAIGMFCMPVIYSICQQILAAATFLKQYSGAVGWILVGGLAGGFVYWYERNFLRQLDTRFPPFPPPQNIPPASPGNFNPPPV